MASNDELVSVNPVEIAMLKQSLGQTKLDLLEQGRHSCVLEMVEITACFY